MEMYLQERDQRLKDRDESRSGAKRRFLGSVEKMGGQKLFGELKTALNLMESIDYNHPGLSKKQYLAHPYRVAKLALEELRPFDIRAVRLALVHNILEMANIDECLVRDVLGFNMLGELKVLTVIRADESTAYRARYYDGIYASEPHVRKVKVLDKMDNMYTLNLHPDLDVRTRYLNEIKKYVRPIVEKDFNDMLRYFDGLVSFCEDTEPFDPLD